jgi:hypothetical protein
MICVDFAGKEREGRDKWGLRNAKLRASRKVLFAGGLIPVLECFRFDREPMRRAGGSWVPTMSSRAG